MSLITHQTNADAERKDGVDLGEALQLHEFAHQVHRTCPPSARELVSSRRQLLVLLTLWTHSGAFYKSKPLETFLRAHCGEASMIDTTCDTSVKTVLQLSVLFFFCFFFEVHH